ncbi:ethanolamine ammonia-lyase reactivating factor EutA [Ureibacillus sp. FSL K6-3587]|jgi:ethanolamine utilization protein EutA|uniref:ethanolamine ammonia-lyase reactivating factor EutA n=1 Tax=Ureibacillus sp. FSL K6-3587 TaxID=2954681 RepID=UPI003158599C
MSKECVISAGIDIGTSTTKLVLSELEIENTAGYGVVPQIKITNKRILYRSSIHRTPLLDEEIIHMPSIRQILLDEFGKANLTPKQIQTGAIIITGETATKHNASEVIHTLSDEMGEFLVATAGADLEGILAAKGSGAFEYSAQHPHSVIANIDIGGGTANIAVIKNKQFLGTCTLHVGGRLIEFQYDKVSFIAPPIRQWIQATNQNITKETNRLNHAITLLINEMVESLFLALHQQIEAHHPLLLGHVPNWDEPIDTIMFSGGVARFLHSNEPARTDDIGWLLAKQINQSELFDQFQIITPTETVAATVIGTSMQTTEISGATIHVETEKLPIKNCPIIVVDFENKLDLSHTIFRAVNQAMEIYRFHTEAISVAWYIKNLPRLSFHHIEEMATQFIELLAPFSIPYIFIFQQDYGKVFGQTLLRFPKNNTIISIDQIQVEHGDYIDIGKALDAGVVPVVIKTLAF